MGAAMINDGGVGTASVGEVVEEVCNAAGA